MKVKEFLNKLSITSYFSNVQIYEMDILLTYLNRDDIIGENYYGCGELEIIKFCFTIYPENTIKIWVKVV